MGGELIRSRGRREGEEYARQHAQHTGRPVPDSGGQRIVAVAGRALERNRQALGPMRRTRPRPERGAAARSRRRPDSRRPGPRVQADLGCRAGTRPRPRANRRSDPQGCGRGAQGTDKAPGPRPVITLRRFRALGVRTKSAFLGSLGLGPKSIWLVIASSSTLLAAARRRRKQTVVSAGTGASGKGRARAVCLLGARRGLRSAGIGHRRCDRLWGSATSAARPVRRFRLVPAFRWKVLQARAAVRRPGAAATASGAASCWAPGDSARIGPS